MTTATLLPRDVDEFFACRPDLIADRFALYRRLRDEAPILRLDTHIVVSRYVDVQNLQLAAEEFHNGGKTDLRAREVRLRYEQLPEDQRYQMAEFVGFRKHWLGHTNGDDHRRLRKLAHKSFTPRTVEGLRQKIEDVTEELLDGAARAGGSIDLISDFAWKLPLIIICDMLGIPRSAMNAIRQWSMDLANLTGGSNFSENLKAAYPSMFALKDLMRTVFQESSTTTATEFMTALLTAQTEDGERFSEDELIGMMAQIVFAGHETTTNLITNAMYLLLDHPPEWDQVRESPDVTASAIEETLRYLSPVQANKRVARSDTEIHGIPIAQDETLTLLVGSANRDPEQFDDPDRFDITRADNRHLAFGMGPHFCLGAALARMEGTIALRALADRFPDIRSSVAEPDWAPNTTFACFTSFPVVLGRDRRR